MDFSSSRLSQSWLSSCLYLSCVILSDSGILFIDYQWTQVAADLNTVFGIFLVDNSEKRSNGGLAVSYRILPLPSNRDSGLRWNATMPIQHCSGSQRGSILFTPMKTYFRSKDLFDYVSWYMTNIIETVKQTNKPTGSCSRNDRRFGEVDWVDYCAIGWTIGWNSVLCRWIGRDKHMPETGV